MNKLNKFIDIVLSWLYFRYILPRINAGATAYQDRRGPGIGKLRSTGWLQAHLDECTEIAQRADERLDAGEYRWQY